MSPEILADLGALFRPSPTSAELVEAAEAFLVEGDRCGFAGIEVMAALYGHEAPEPRGTPVTSR